MKKISTYLLAGLMACTLAGCSNEPAPQESNPSTSDTVYKIGLAQIVEHTSLNTIRESMLAELEVLGYKDGENIIVDAKNAQGEQSTLNSIMQTFAGDEKDIIVAIATPTAAAAAPYAENIPVIFSAVSDPVSAGLVTDPSKPDKNITGTSDEIQVAQILDLAVTIDPELKTLGYIYNAGEANSVSNLEKVKAYCEDHGLTLVEATISSAADIQQTAQVLASKVDAIFAPNDNTIASSIDALNMAAQQVQCPVYVGADSMVQDGGFASIGINYEDLGKETARMIVQVLEGSDISDIPVKVFDTNLYTYFNKTTADVLGITIPDALLNDEKTVIFE